MTSSQNHIEIQIYDAKLKTLHRLTSCKLAPNQPPNLSSPTAPPDPGHRPPAAHPRPAVARSTISLFLTVLSSLRLPYPAAMRRRVANVSRSSSRPRTITRAGEPPQWRRAATVTRPSLRYSHGLGCRPTPAERAANRESTGSLRLAHASALADQWTMTSQGHVTMSTLSAPHHVTTGGDSVLKTLHILRAAQVERQFLRRSLPACPPVLPTH